MGFVHKSVMHECTFCRFNMNYKEIMQFFFLYPPTGHQQATSKSSWVSDEFCGHFSCMWVQSICFISCFQRCFSSFFCLKQKSKKLPFSLLKGDCERKSGLFSHWIAFQKGERKAGDTETPVHLNQWNLPSGYMLLNYFRPLCSDVNARGQPRGRQYEGGGWGRGSARSPLHSFAAWSHHLEWLKLDPACISQRSWFHWCAY